jgi:hypothetical protein
VITVGAAVLSLAVFLFRDRFVDSEGRVEPERRGTVRKRPLRLASQ